MSEPASQDHGVRWSVNGHTFDAWGYTREGATALVAEFDAASCVVVRDVGEAREVNEDGVTE